MLGKGRPDVFILAEEGVGGLPAEGPPPGIFTAPLVDVFPDGYPDGAVENAEAYLPRLFHNYYFAGCDCAVYEAVR